jgi:hypothetical protein
MKILQLLISAALLANAAPARSLNPTDNGFAFSEVGEPDTSRVSPEHVLKTADFAISRFDESVVGEFTKAWRRSLNGTSSVEAVVLILKMRDGTYKGRELGATNENKRFTFRWHPGAIAVVHTHPNSADPKPTDEDLHVADHYGVPVFTITNRGMYVYDPISKKIRRVLEGLDWLNASKFSNATLAARH